MKIRSNYISNSSSSSFIINKDLSNGGINCAHISLENACQIIYRKIRSIFIGYNGSNSYQNEEIDNITWLLKNANSLYITEILEETFSLTHIKGIKRSIRYMGGDNGAPYNTDICHMIKNNTSHHPIWIYNCDDPVIDNGVPMLELIQKIGDQYGNYAAVSFQDDIIKIAKKIDGAEYL